MTEMQLGDYHYKDDGPRMVLPLRFIPQGGYYPLLSIPNVYRGTDNPYFTGMHDRRTTSRLWDKLSLDSAGYPIKYRKNGSAYDTAMNLYTGFLSAMGTIRDFDYMPSTLTGDGAEYRMKGDVDIFCLGVIELAHLPELIYGGTKSKYRRYRSSSSHVTIKFDVSKVKILLNIDKLRRAQFCKDNYSVTVRSTLLGKIKRLRADLKITVEEISDEEIERFAISPNAVRTNSIVEILELKDRLRDSVFSNLNTATVV